MKKTVNVVAAVIRSGDRIFATQRGYGDDKDFWEFPGGKVEPGETPRQALAREIREELDTEISVGELLAVVEYDYPAFHLHMDCFWAAVTAGKLTLKEHEAARWLASDELEAVPWLPADRTLVPRIREGLQTPENAKAGKPEEKTAAPFQNTYFINGNACAGKSTLVRLLAEKHGGIACEENYHDALLPELDPADFPCLCWSRDLKDWRDFIRRTPEAYEAWYDGVTKECETLELRLLKERCGQGRPVFVDTNISPETLRAVAEPGHVLIMLADPEISVRRFFERPDREKQFLYRLIQAEPDPAAAMENYRRGLERINSPARYEAFLRAGFPVLLRDEARSPAETLRLAEGILGLTSG